MKRLSTNNIVLKALGLLLLTAAVLKGHELLTVPVANKDLWTWRLFLIFQVEFELVLGIWLLSGVFKRLAWLAALTCFSLFCCVTLYKGLSGAASCGCFGRVHVNPWITLIAINLPAVIGLSFFRPVLSFGSLLSFLGRQESICSITRDFLKPWASSFRFLITVGFSLLVLSTTTPILALNKPVLATSTYEVLEPETWVGKGLPILEYIDIAEQLQTGTWLLLLYRHDCPDCQKAIPQYEQMAQNLAGNEDFLRIALIGIPPYGRPPVSLESSRVLGHLAEVKEWLVTTPATVLLANGKVKAAWEETTPSFNTILVSIEEPRAEVRDFRNDSRDSIGQIPIGRKEVMAMDKYPVGFQ
jgi:thiol-disulfide isomerase/thioredoxin